jgi:hypothetical protein
MAKLIKEQEHVRSRYLQAIDEIKKETMDSYTAIMQSLGDHQQSLALLRNGARYPTLLNLVLLCQKYSYLPAWVLLGEGKRKLKDDNLAGRIADIEKELRDIKKKLKIQS